ncbi:MAG: hypothetical protein JJU06_16745 [Ectothiorhodospiraceae bacterium]|nr:hypothetical protein [Ectothiorhodospiraceae bacterium]
MTFPQYSEYRDSKVDWLGNLPAHWGVKRVKHFTRSLEQGWSPQCENIPAEGDEWGVLKVGCVNGGVFNPSENKLLPPNLPPSPELGIRRGDVLISRANTRELVGSAAVALQDYPALLLCDKLYRLRVDTRRCLPIYLAYIFGTKAARSQIELAATGASSSMLNIGQATVSELHLPAPPVDEQSTIAAFLHHETAKIDALVSEQQRLIELLKEKRQAVISHAVTKGLDPGVPMKDSGMEGLGEVPAHWSIGALRWYGTIQGGVAKGKDYGGKTKVSLPYLRVANVQDGYVDLEDVREIEVLAEEVERYSLRSGDVLMNEGGDNDKLGRGTVWRAQIDPCLHQNHVFAIRTNEHLLPEWLTLFTQSVQARSYFFIHSKQSTNLASISSSNVMSCVLPIPPVDEQSQTVHNVERRAEQFDKMIAEAVRGIGLLQERRAGLISAAVTGKIDVRGWRPRSGEPDTASTPDVAPMETSVCG